MSPSLALRVALVSVLTAACGAAPVPAPGGPSAGLAPASLVDPRERQLGALTQLTFAGENAEAYWSWGGDELIFQRSAPPFACDQIFTVPAAGGEPQLVSTGLGRATCSYFFPGDRRIVYASTHLGDAACPPEPDRSQGYVWPLYPTYDLFSQRVDGGDSVRLTDTPGYDAEATICGSTGAIVFTSVRDGDLELYRMDADGSNLRRLTHTPGYDGGAFFSPDCRKIVWRASRPREGAELDEYRRLLAQHLVRPSQLELWVADADGAEPRQITHLGAASFGPSFFPSGERVIFSSNFGDPAGREFDLFAVNLDGTALERVTVAPGFDGFPLFSPDGKRLAFSSNRNQARPGETNVFVTTWQGGAPELETRAPDRVAADVSWLADDAREGRGVGSAGLAAASEYLAERFAALGLAPMGEGGFRRPFELAVGVNPAKENVVVIDGTAIPSAAFVPLGFSSSAELSGAVVAAGHGVTAPELDHDDYAKLNVRGKIVVVRRYVPPGGRFDDDRMQRRYGDLRYKAWNAREHGARALLVVDAPVGKPGEPLPDEAPLPPLVLDAHGDAGLPVIAVTRSVGARLFTGDRHKAALAVKLTFDVRPSWNVVGRIAAGGAPLGGALVVGAHYDHLGLGGPGSLAPGSALPHNGADDNASGTAALLEVGKLLVARRGELRRDVILVAFSGEEWGAIGSADFVRRPPPGAAPTELVAMLNMDMVGRLRENRLSVLGTESAAEWPALVAPACERARLGCALGGDGYGPSDQISFYTAGVPVLHFFTGAHRDYHKPTDDAQFVHAGGAAQVAVLVADLALVVASREERLTYRTASAPAPGGDVRSHGASLGTVPDYVGPADGRPGVLLAGVRAGGPAEAAGLARGDLLVAIGTHEVRNVEDLMFVLRRSKPGEKAKVRFERDGVPAECEVTFGRAPQR